MRIECNGDRVSMSKNEYRQVMNKQDNYKQQRDLLIKDVEKLREEKEELKQENERLMKAHSSSWAEKDKVIKKLSYKYRTLAKHIRDKAEHNPGNSRYISLVHFIEDMERDNDEG